MSSYSQRTLIGQAVSSFGKGSGEPAMITKVDAFTVNGTFTPPAGVNYAVAYILAGGGGTGASSGAGGNSSVAFASGTITATGGPLAGGNNGVAGFSVAGQVNSGNGGKFYNNDGATTRFMTAQDGAYIVAGGAVTPGTGITVTVGAGGVGANGAAGGSGYVYIEYQVKA